MIRYILQRLIFITINIVIISVIVFMMSRSLNQDPVDNLLSNEQFNLVNPDQYDKEYRQLSHTLGYDLPLFYFSLGRASSPDTLHKIPRYRRSFAQVLIKEVGHWPSIQNFITGLDRNQADDASLQLLTQIRSGRSISEIEALIQPGSKLRPLLDQLMQNKSRYRHFIPRFSWHGSDNQFHKWLIMAARGDFGLSSVDGRSVSTKMSEAIQWTLILNILALIFIFSFGIFIGVWAGYTHRTFLKKTIRILIYSFYAIPIFWLATLLIVFFTTDDYGAWTNLFAPVGILNNCHGQGIVSCFLFNIQFMILPLICLVLPSLAYVSRQMESSMVTESKKRYALFLKSQGHSRRSIYYSHLLKNAMTPIITVIGSALPALLSGSLIIEIIFNIPGIGRLLYESIFASDWNVVFQLVIISSIIVMASYLIVDLLYKWVNPKVNLHG